MDRFHYSRVLLDRFRNFAVLLMCFQIFWFGGRFLLPFFRGDFVLLFIVSWEWEDCGIRYRCFCRLWVKYTYSSCCVEWSDASSKSTRRMSTRLFFWARAIEFGRMWTRRDVSVTDSLAFITSKNVFTMYQHFKTRSRSLEHCVSQVQGLNSTHESCFGVL